MNKQHILNGYGKRAIRDFIGRFCRPGCNAEAWFPEAEAEADQSLPIGNDAVIEVGAQFSRDGHPYTLTLRDIWFDEILLPD